VLLDVPLGLLRSMLGLIDGLVSAADFSVSVVVPLTAKRIAGERADAVACFVNLNHGCAASGQNPEGVSVGHGDLLFV
jgi:hypothetical protein